MAKKYIVDLSIEERTYLQTLIKKGKRSASQIRRAHILLLANEEKTDTTIAETLHIGLRTVERTRQKFVEGGVDWALSDRPKPAQQTKLDGKQEAFLIATACSNPPEGRTKWTMQLLADRLISLGIVESISDETVRRTLKKTMSTRG
jgi:transposase